MMKKVDCNQEFQKTAQEFFPEWDRTGWKAEFGTTKGQGSCNGKSKTIRVPRQFSKWDEEWTDEHTGKPIPEDEFILYRECILIHEMCHAILASRGKRGLAANHNFHFYELMRKAIDHAKNTAQVPLASLLEVSLHDTKIIHDRFDNQLRNPSDLLASNQEYLKGELEFLFSE